MSLSKEVHKTLGVCIDTQRLKSGILADGTTIQVKSKLAEILMASGLSYEETIVVVNQVWHECKYLLEEATELSCKGSVELFKMLKQKKVIVILLLLLLFYFFYFFFTFILLFFILILIIVIIIIQYTVSKVIIILIIIIITSSFNIDSIFDTNL